MIRKLSVADFQNILSIVNEAAIAYKGKIPTDCWKEPYMRKEELMEEVENGVQFYGYVQENALVAVMGIQPVLDVTLIRHAYTLTNHQRQGIGTKLINQLLSLSITQRILVGTWETATWAVHFYKNHGFKLHTRKETNKLLHKYWKISQRQVETSVVLELER